MANHSVDFSAARLERMANEQRLNGFTHRVSVLAADINKADWSADGDTATVELFQTPKNWIITKVAAVVRKAFAGDGTIAVEVGTEADSDALIALASVKTAGVIAATAGAVPATTAAGSSSVPILAKFATQASTGALSDITAGSVDFIFEVVDADAID